MGWRPFERVIVELENAKMLHLTDPGRQLGESVCVHRKNTQRNEPAGLIWQLTDLVATKIQNLEVGHLGDTFGEVSKVVGPYVEITQTAKISEAVGKPCEMVIAKCKAHRVMLDHFNKSVWHTVDALVAEIESVYSTGAGAATASL